MANLFLLFLLSITAAQIHCANRKALWDAIMDPASPDVQLANLPANFNFRPRRITQLISGNEFQQVHGFTSAGRVVIVHHRDLIKDAEAMKKILSTKRNAPWLFHYNPPNHSFALQFFKEESAFIPI